MRVPNLYKLAVANQISELGITVSKFGYGNQYLVLSEILQLHKNYISQEKALTS